VKPWRQGLALMWRFLGRGRSRPAAILLAVAWGTLSMMLLLAFGEGLKRQMDVGRLGLGDDPVILWPGATTKAWEGMKPGRPLRFEEEDIAALRRSVPELDEIAGEYQSWAVDMRWGTTSVSAHLTGVMPCYERIRSHIPQPGGRFLNDLDQEKARRVLFLGPDLKDRLLGRAEAIGQTVFVRGVPFTIVGVMIQKQQNGMYGGPDTDKACIPVSTYQEIFGKRPFDNLLYTVAPGYSTSEVEPQVREIFARRQRFDPSDRSAIGFWDTARNRVESDKIFRAIQIFLGMVGAMTLLVAGVGLANMLFVMVGRRTREIGLSMAIGAHRAAVTSQIIGEALVLAGIGGYLGIGLSWLLVELLQRVPVRSQALQFLGKPTLSLPLGIVTAVVLVGIGCLAGALPARRASRLNPVEALRHE
jgi:putative ABC transport system permease protein